MPSENDVISDRYEILRILGQGGMGKVYLALDRTNSKHIALKTLLSRSPGGLFRFQREFRSIARLHHANVIEVFSYGLMDESPFFTMEFIEGFTLREYLTDWQKTLHKDDPRHTQRLVKTCRIFSQICSALYYIHTHGLIHRDIKPGNIMVKQDDKAKLMDFGLARDLDSSLALTRTGAVMGTVAYMSPEQCRGLKLDARSDLYSLGAVMYELLAGRKPFISDRPVDILFKHVEEIPESPALLKPEIPDEIERIIMRLLQKDPGLRFQTALELKNKWDEFLSFISEETVTFSASDVVSEETKRIELFYHPKFIGRIQEKKQLSILIERLMNHIGSFALIGGPTGCGKSRLADECAGFARLKSVKVFIARCFPDENIPYRAVSEFMDAVSVILWKKSIDQQRKILGQDGKILARAFPGFLQLPAVQESPEPVLLHGKEDRIRLFKAVCDFLRRLTEDQPVLIIFDNLQWSDADALDLLEYIGNTMRAVSGEALDQLSLNLAVIGIFRSSHASDSSELTSFLKKMEALPNLTNIQLMPLDFDETQQMLVSMLGTDTPPKQLARWLFEQTGGNPLFLEEIIKNMLERGVLYKRRSRWKLDLHDGQTISADFSSPDFKNLPISDNIRELISKRLEFLSPDAKKLLDWIAVAGKSVTFQILQNILADDTESLLDALNELLNHGILIEKRGLVDEQFEFAQVLIQELMYDALFSPRKKSYHRRLAEYFETLPDKSIVIEDLARHWQASDKPHLAPPYLLEAGKRARRAYAHSNAIRLLTQSIDIIQKEKYAGLIENEYSIFIESLNLRGDSWDDTGYPGLALADYQTVLNTAQNRKDELNEARAYNKIAAVQWMRGQYKDSIDSNERSLEIWKKLEIPEAYFMCIRNLGVCYQSLGDYNSSMDYFNLALDKARKLNNKSIQVSALNDLGRTLITIGKPLDAERYFREYELIARTDKKKKHFIRAVSNLAVSAFLSGRMDEAEDLTQTAMKSAEEIDYQQARAVILSNYGMIIAAMGRVQEARSMHEESLMMSKDLEDKNLCADNMFRLGQDLTMLGSYLQAVKCMQDSADQFKKMEAYGDEFEVHLALMKVFEYLGFPEEALSEYQRLKALLQLTKNPRYFTILEYLDIRNKIMSPDPMGSAEEIREYFSVIDSKRDSIQVIRDLEAIERLHAIWLFKKDNNEEAIRIRRTIIDQNLSRNEIGMVIHIVIDHCQQLLERGNSKAAQEWIQMYRDRCVNWIGECENIRWQVVCGEINRIKRNWMVLASDMEKLMEIFRGQREQMLEQEFKLYMKSGLRLMTINLLLKSYSHLNAQSSINNLRSEFSFLF